MGLNFNYRIYVKKEKLKETFKYLLDKCQNEGLSIEYKNGQFYKIEYPHLPLNKQKKRRIEDLIKERNLGGTSLLFERDDRILEYYLREHCKVYNPESETSLKISLTNNFFPIGSIDITLKNYSDKIPNIIEICFMAATSSMSRLFEESKSIEMFFQSFCKDVEAEYGCLDKEHKGYRLIWFEGEKYSLNLPHSESGSSNEPFRKYGFIPVLKMISKKNKS